MCSSLSTAMMTGHITNSSVALILASTLAAGCSDSNACLAFDAGAGSAAGELVFEQLFADGTHDLAREIAVDPCTGDVAVTGYLWSNEAGADRNLWVAALNHEGTPRWDLQVHHVFDDAGRAVAIADDGSLIVAGTSEFGEFPGSAFDAGWLARFDADGSERWRLRVEVDDYHTRFGALALDRDRIYVTDTRQHWTLSTTAIARAYTLDGELLWRREDQSVNVLRNVFVLDGGELLLLGTRDESLLLQRLSREGELRDEVLVADIRPNSDAAVLTPEQDLVVVHSINQSAISRLRLDGTRIWDIALDPDEHPYDLDVADDGAIYVSGYDGADTGVGHPWVAVLEGDGTRRWSTTVAREGIADAVAVGPQGDLFTAGHVDVTPAVPGGRNQDIWIARFGG
jgi:hypothetical protein